MARDNAAPSSEVIRQIAEGEYQARFMGEWDGERWRIGKRLQDTTIKRGVRTSDVAAVRANNCREQVQYAMAYSITSSAVIGGRGFWP